jgi:hypothetical protein
MSLALIFEIDGFEGDQGNSPLDRIAPDLGVEVLPPKRRKVAQFIPRRDLFQYLRNVWPSRRGGENGPNPISPKERKVALAHFVFSQ